MENIYFDYASTTPVDPAVMAAMEPFFFKQFGNPSSPHWFGREAQKVLEQARETLACFIGAGPDEVVFSSGATEANNHAVIGVSRALKDKGNHIIVSAVEHHSVLEPVEFLVKQGFKVSYLNVDENGLIDFPSLERMITDQTILIAVMHAGNEIGTIQPVSEIGFIAKKHGIPFLVDAVQTVGHVPVNVDELGADLLSLSAHKFYGPKGIGALYIRKGTKIDSFLMGGDQEQGRRASTQNVAGAVGLAKAVELCRDKMTHEIEVQTRLRDSLFAQVSQRIKGVKINGDRHSRLPNNAHFSFEGLQGESLLMSLDLAGIAASMGSACSSGAMESSHVLRAIGLSDELAHGALRITIGRWTTEEHIEYFLDQLPRMVNSLRI